MVERVLRETSALRPSGLCVIVGHGGDAVKSHVLDVSPRAAFAVQKVLNGSGGAVRQALAWLKKQKGDVIKNMLITVNSKKDMVFLDVKGSFTADDISKMINIASDK